MHWFCVHLSQQFMPVTILMDIHNICIVQGAVIIDFTVSLRITLYFQLPCCLHRAELIRSFTCNTGCIFLRHFLNLDGGDHVRVVKLAFFALNYLHLITEPGDGWGGFSADFTFHVGGLA